jgi:hypothetical protein
MHTAAPDGMYVALPILTTRFLVLPVL